jgi:hypothetical protein
VTTTRRCPHRSTSRGESGAANMNATGIGNSRAPACNGLKPSTSWMYCVSMKMTPYIVKKMNVIVAVAAVSDAFLNHRTSSIGCSMCVSQPTKATNSTTDATIATIGGGLAQPDIGASMIANTSDPRATMDSSAPTGSSVTRRS